MQTFFIYIHFTHLHALRQASLKTALGFQTAILKVRDAHWHAPPFFIVTVACEVCRAALADAKATIADVTRLRWESEGKELDANQQLALVVAERDALKAKLLQQQDDSVQVRRVCVFIVAKANSDIYVCLCVVLTWFTVQLLLQLEQEKGEKQQLDWLVNEGKKQVQRRTMNLFVCVRVRVRVCTSLCVCTRMHIALHDDGTRLQQGCRVCRPYRKTATLQLVRFGGCCCLPHVRHGFPCLASRR
jgi:hypothetical protein